MLKEPINAIITMTNLILRHLQNRFIIKCHKNEDPYLKMLKRLFSIKENANFYKCSSKLIFIITKTLFKIFGQNQ